MGFNHRPLSHVAGVKPGMGPGTVPVEWRVFLAMSNGTWVAAGVSDDGRLDGGRVPGPSPWGKKVSPTGPSRPTKEIEYCCMSTPLLSATLPPAHTETTSPSSLIATEGVFWSYAFVVFTRNEFPSGEPLGANCCPYTIHLLPEPVLPGALDQLKSTLPLLSMALAEYIWSKLVVGLTWNSLLKGLPEESYSRA